MTTAALQNALAQLRQHCAAGKWQEALLLVARTVALHPGKTHELAEVLNLGGVAAAQLGNAGAAEHYWRQALAANPRFAEALGNLGFLLARLGRPAEAEPALRQALQWRPQDFNVSFNLAMLLMSLGRRDEAAVQCQHVLSINPRHADAALLLANLLAMRGQATDAEACYRLAISCNPALVDACNNLGLLLMAQARMAEAEGLFRRAIELRPEHARYWTMLGGILVNLGRMAEAEAVCRRAIELEPGYGISYNNLGSALKALKQTDAADAAFRRCLELAPDCFEAWVNFGELRQSQEDYTAAASAYERAHQLRPQDGNALLEWLRSRCFIADWENIEAAGQHLGGLIESGSGLMPPFQLLAFGGISPQQHWLASRRYAEMALALPLQEPALVPGRVQPRERLRIGYLSADFHNHATVYLLAGVLEQHDRSRFEVTLYSYGPGSAAPERNRLLQAGHRFQDMGGLSDAEAAQHIAADGIDILIDLKGYTGQARPGITARRPAPVIVNWLGYPGSLGHPRLADYFIGDPLASPLAHAAHFSETLALLPDCYQPNDNTRVIGRRPTRAEVGLPEQGFVFCNFNQTYKTTPALFRLWCRLLAAVPGSVLWQLRPAQHGEANLRREAEQAGIDPARLIFAPTLTHSDHLARLQLADLALDTSPCASHTTASDALWDGVPLVARLGEHFVSRVAASLVRAVDLPELVANTDEEYFQLALQLAQNPAQLTALRERLRQNRLSQPLFDTVRFTRELEALYQRIWEQECRGERQALPAQRVSR